MTRPTTPETHRRHGFPIAQAPRTVRHNLDGRAGARYATAYRTQSALPARRRGGVSGSDPTGRGRTNELPARLAFTWQSA